MKPIIFLFKATLCVVLFISPICTYSQDTWSDIHAIFQTSCDGNSCHSSSAPNPLKLIGTSSAVYNNIINVTPLNLDASAKGYKLIDPGHPHLSFLLKKINNGVDPDNDIDALAQGDMMPSTGPALTDEQIELINAWILHGAPETGNVVDQQIITNYYSGLGLAQGTPPPAPDSSEGFQIHLGPLFLAPGDEKEFFKKLKLPNIADSMEITRIESFIDAESHHYIIYKFDNQVAADAILKNGLREVVGLADAFVNGTSMVTAWQNSSDVVLPNNTAYFWEGNPTLDLNLHIRNYSTDSVLKTSVYSNVYLQPKQNTTIEMISDLTLYSTAPLSLWPCNTGNPFCIPADGMDHTFTSDVTSQNLIAGPNDSMYIWLLSSHTHKFGVGYNIYTRNTGGGIKQQVYDGFYNFDYTAYQGYYDYEDPSVRYFDPDTFVIAAQDGLIHEATFNNDSSIEVSFGLTTNDEMMLMFLQYTLEPPSAVVQTAISDRKEFSVNVMPNPSISSSEILFVRDYVRKNELIVLYNLLGEEIITQAFPLGEKKLYLEKNLLSPGIYIYKSMAGNILLHSGKLIVN